jgi:hypothetical protein
MAKAMRFLAGAALAAGLALPVWAEDAPTADTVVATVNGTAITLGHMIVARDSLPEEYKALPPDVLFKGIMDQLIQQTALEQSMAGKLTKRDALQIDNDTRGYVSGRALEGVVMSAVTDEACKPPMTRGSRMPPRKPNTARPIFWSRTRPRRLTFWPKCRAGPILPNWPRPIPPIPGRAPMAAIWAGSGWA